MRNMPLGRAVQVLAPLIPENTRWWDAGPVRIGLEQRVLLIEIDRTVWPDATDQSYDDGGETIHVVDAVTNREYLRFDCFREDPHYHYNVPTGEEDHNHVVVFDVFANGDDMFSWVVDRLRTRLGSMLSNTGGAPLVDHLEPAAIGAVLDDVVAAAGRA